MRIHVNGTKQVRKYMYAYVFGLVLALKLQNIYSAFQERSKNIELDTHIKGRLLMQPVILNNASIFFFKLETSFKGKNY